MRQMCFTLFWLCFASFPLYASEISFKKEIMETVETPKYLYKVLSPRHWQATQNRKTVALPAEDDAFIHFSTEEQLEKIITKYWSEAPQFVVLKIDAGKLEGEFVFEAEGSTKYYHLYNGFIPFSAIVESKIVYNQPQDSCNLHKLDIVQIGDPVLRQPARELSVEEILSPEIQDLIQSMQATLRAAPGVGLAAPQIGKQIQLVVVEDVDQTHLTSQQLLERDRYIVPFHVIINPRISVDEVDDTVDFFEGCLSVPGFFGNCPESQVCTR